MSQSTEVVQTILEDEDVQTILCVDDEANILSSLRRLLRSHGYKLLFAGGGKEGLSIMEEHPVDLVISDMRMPEMDGARFLTEVSERWPETMRILLTGYSDITSTIEAINKAQIFKYISKPWEDNDILLSIKRALELKNLKRDRQRLEKLTLKQNEELKDLNTNLESMVKARTAEIEQTLDMYEMANDELKNSFSSVVEVFSNLIAMRRGNSAEHIRTVADTARRVATKMDLSISQIQDVYHAALLKDIGLIGFSDDLLNMPFDSLRASEKEKVSQHPVIAQGLLMSLEPLQDVAFLIRCRHEHFDGSGYPDGLGTSTIPLGARILCAVDDYYGLQIGSVLTEKLSAALAKKYLQDNCKKRYDPAVVAVLLENIVDVTVDKKETKKGASVVKTSGLKTGMVLIADLVSAGGLVLLPKGYIINDEVVQRISNLERSIGETFELSVSEGE